MHGGSGFLRGGAVAVPEAARVVCESAWASVGRAGTWWTGAERVAVAAAARAARDCRLCGERKAALSPYVVPGEHGAAGPLPAVAVDAVHRIATDAGRLTSRWCEGVLAALGEERYVELVGVVTAVVVVDSLARGVGAVPPALPQALAGQPTRERPTGLSRETAWVSTASSGEGFVPNILRSLTLVPAESAVFASLQSALYVGDVLDVRGAPGGALTRPEVELVAAATSEANDCFY